HQGDPTRRLPAQSAHSGPPGAPGHDAGAELSRAPAAVRVPHPRVPARARVGRALPLIWLGRGAPRPPELRTAYRTSPQAGDHAPAARSPATRCVLSTPPTLPWPDIPPPTPLWLTAHDHPCLARPPPAAQAPLALPLTR